MAQLYNNITSIFIFCENFRVERGDIQVKLDVNLFVRDRLRQRSNLLRHTHNEQTPLSQLNWE